MDKLPAAKFYIKPANKLVRNINQQRELSERIREIINSIQEEIRATIDERKQSLIYSLPTNFDISGMPPNIAQKNIYFSILSTLHQSEYIAKIKFMGRNSESQRVLLYISWKTVDVIETEDAMNNYILKYTA
jgi:Flp pilus assembly CpaF family ATPase